MPSFDLFDRFQDDLRIDQRWWVDGTHYERTANAWLDNLDRHRDLVRQTLQGVYGSGDVDLWLQRWRMFFMACAELFGFDRGRQWGVGHYLWSRS